MSSSDNKVDLARKNSYINYIKKLNQLKSDISNAYLNLVNSKTNFENGGYINDGVIIGGDTLSNACKTLEQNLESIDNIISKTQTIVDNMVVE